jgi:hypothetical protein
MRAAAITIGVLVTVAFGPWAAIFVYLSASRIYAANTPVFLLWGLAGVLGLAGFWAWVAMKEALADRTRIAVTSFLLVGIAAIAPLLFVRNMFTAMPQALWAVLIVLAILSAVGIAIAVSPNIRKAVLVSSIAGTFGIAASVGTNAWLIDGIDGWLWSLSLEEDTVYAPGYSDAAFRGIRRGMSVEEVHKLLGPPLSRWDVSWTDDGGNFSERWSHSPGDTNFRNRVVRFRAGHVDWKHAEFYVD